VGQSKKGCRIVSGTTGQVGYSTSDRPAHLNWLKNSTSRQQSHEYAHIHWERKRRVGKTRQPTKEFSNNYTDTNVHIHTCIYSEYSLGCVRAGFPLGVIRAFSIGEKVKKSQQQKLTDCVAYVCGAVLNAQIPLVGVACHTIHTHTHTHHCSSTTQTINLKLAKVADDSCGGRTFFAI